ncbi:unnamed protein product [Paramecium pentaurelia]|uniref:Uncharacterized protein n=1 Tax=Paramecium pentaurelia TaxID=43138 RepID=A0A8S1UFU2_9CILI|nr:unnamed protein product [Paramecium pentaurelia]
MSSNIELVPFYSSLLRTIQSMYQQKLITAEERSELKNFVVSHDSKDLGQLFKSYEKGQLEQFILENYINPRNNEQFIEDEDDSCYSISEIECQKSTLSCTPNYFLWQLKQSKQTKQEKEGNRKRSNSFTTFKQL